MNKVVFLIHYSKYGEIFKLLTLELEISEEFFHLIPDGTDGEKKLVSYVREQRPVGVIIDPAYATENQLENICKSVYDAIGAFDIDCRLYSLGDKINFPGVGIVTKEDIKDIFNS